MNENNGNGMNGNNEYNGPGGNGDARPLTFEEQISRLEQIVARLEHGDAPLAESLTLFEEGTRLAASCARQLDQAEQAVSYGLMAQSEYDALEQTLMDGEQDYQDGMDQLSDARDQRGVADDAAQGVADADFGRLRAAHRRRCGDENLRQCGAERHDRRADDDLRDFQPLCDGDRRVDELIARHADEPQTDDEQDDGPEQGIGDRK